MNILRAAVLIWIAAVEVLSFSGRLTTFSRNLFRVSDRTNNVKLHQIGGSFNRDMAPVGTFTENIKGGVFSSIINIAHLFKVICVDVYDYIVNLVRGDDSSKLISQFYSGKCIVVTGASSGIGEALAMTLSSIPDTTVVISARSLEKLEEIASACKSQYPNSRVLPVTLDLEQYEHLGEYKDRLIAVLDKNGLSERVDVLINNAGISSRGTALDTSMETLEKLMRVNFYGPVALTRALVSTMVSQGTTGTRSIGVISSVQGKLGIPFRTSYAASKHALQGYFDGLRAELAESDVSVTIVSPGYVKTSLSLNALNADGTKYNKMDDTTASGMDPQEVAKKILVSMAKKEADVVLADAKTRAAVQLKVLFPEFLAWIMKKRAKPGFQQ